MSSPLTLSPEVLEKILQAAKQVQGDPYRFKAYFDKPVEFCFDILGVNLWEKQAEFVIAVRDNRRVVVRSGHGVGKTFGCACLVIWWTYGRQGLVVSTAPTKEHVEDVLWREIAARVKAAPVPLPGQHYKTGIVIDPTWFATGLSTDRASAFQGRHHPRLLVLGDEAPGINEAVHLQMETLATGQGNRIALIGNPTETSGTFYEAFGMPDIWHTMKISCLDHPNVVSGKELIEGAVTRRWVEDRRRVWGEEHPFWFSRVLGEFPKTSSRGVIPLGRVEAATNSAKHAAALRREIKLGTPRIGGLDVARYGANKSVLTVRRGDAVEWQEEWAHRSLTTTAGLATRAIREHGLEKLVIDASGIGAGVFDIMNENNLPVLAYNGGHRAFTRDSFTNRRSEMMWHLRERLERRRIWFPEKTLWVKVLTHEMVQPQYEIKPTGRIQVESKEKMLDDGKPSPDHFDSLVLAYATEEGPLEEPAPEPEPEQDVDAFYEMHPIEQSDFAQLPVGF